MDFQKALKKAENLKVNNVRRDLFKYIRSIEKEFINFNISQIEDSKGSDGSLLENRDSKYSGVYSETTEALASLENPIAPKRAGDPYNFLWSGDFIKGFELFIRNGELTLFSTGTGSGDKKAFFDGYKDLFGLTDENLQKVIDNNLLPFFINYYRKNLF